MPAVTSAHSPEQTKQRAGCTQALASANYPQITRKSCPKRLGRVTGQLCPQAGAFLAKVGLDFFVLPEFMSLHAGVINELY